MEKFLELNSEQNHDDYCLAYVFTDRDFDDGVLGLAWVGAPSGADTFMFVSEEGREVSSPPRDNDAFCSVPHVHVDLFDSLGTSFRYQLRRYADVPVPGGSFSCSWCAAVAAAMLSKPRFCLKF